MRQAQKITTYLWFDDNAEEAAKLYVSTFNNARLLQVHRVPDRSPSGKASLVTFEINGQRFIALNGGPQFRFTEAISLFVACDSQEEVDRLWAALIADGGEPSQRGWLKDRFGLSWQIIPSRLMQLMSDPDPEKSGGVMKAMLQMGKIEIDRLEAAYAAA